MLRVACCALHVTPRVYTNMLRLGMLDPMDSQYYVNQVGGGAARRSMQADNGN